MRVLLIEDEPSTAKAVELMLTAEGFNVYSTDLGEEGLDLGKLYDYDIILLDLNLPDMHGYDVLKNLRVAKVETPVLILSGISEISRACNKNAFPEPDWGPGPTPLHPNPDPAAARIGNQGRIGARIRPAARLPTIRYRSAPAHRAGNAAPTPP